MKLARGLYKFTAGTILLAVFIYPAHAEEILLSAQQNLTLGNSTLVVEDADSQAGRVWLRVFTDHGPPQSFAAIVGEAFRFGELTFRVLRIYAGDGTDLVALEIHSKKMPLDWYYRKSCEK
jgi:hypothetical protein